MVFATKLEILVRSGDVQTASEVKTKIKNVYVTRGMLGIGPLGFIYH